MTTAGSSAHNAPDGAVISLRSEEDYESLSLFQLAMRRIRHDYLTLAALTVLIILGVLSLLAPVISDALDVSYRRTNMANTFASPGDPGHILGTDDLGRDELARLLYAGQVSLGIAFSAAALSLLIGTTVGVIAGYNQGGRSEEHTSELQSRENLVCRLLLEKKYKH